MKRLLLIILLTSVQSSYAQYESGKWVLGATVNADFSSESDDRVGVGSIQTNLNNFGFNVEGGHLLRDNFLVSLSLGYSRTNTFDSSDVRDRGISNISDVYKGNNFSFGFGVSKIIPAGDHWAFSTGFQFSAASGSGKGQTNISNGSQSASGKVVVLSEGRNTDLFIGARLGIWFKPLDKFGIKVNYAKLGYDWQSSNLEYSDATDVASNYKGFGIDLSPASLEFGVFWLL